MTDTVYATRLPDPDTRADVYAGVPLKRGLAWLIDMVLIIVLSLFALPFTAFLGVFFFPFMMLVLGFFYRWFTIAGGSATWGMRMMGVELRDNDGQRLSSGTAFWHTLGYSVSVAVFPLQLISVAMMLGTARKQGLSDQLLGTAAVNRLL